MSQSLYSTSWYLVRDLIVSLRPQTEIHRHIYQGQVWYVLQDKVTGQYHRFSTESYRIIGLMDGERSLDEIWEEACRLLGDELPSQDEVIALVSKLFQANVLHSDRLPDIPALNQRHAAIEKQRLINQIKSPIAIRIPLWDPEKFLSNTIGVVRPLLGRFGLLLWLIIVGIGLSQLAIHWDALTQNSSDRILSFNNLLMTACLYPFIKAIHELGHAYLIKHWGGEVHEIGLMLLVFFPVPYVEASAATAFPSKYRRMLVGAAGILIEILIAALAMILWAQVEPGFVRAMALNAMLIAGISTLAFNGNPLLKFDAYYVLADYVEIPNLAARANQYFFYLCKRYLFRIENLIAPETSPRERVMLFSYAVASFCYRLFVMIAIALFLSTQYFFVGTLLALWSLYMMLGKPLAKIMAAPFSEPSLYQKRHQLLATGGAIAGVVLILVAVIPFPLATSTEGALLPSEQSKLRASVSGYIADVRGRSGELVTKGEPIIRFDSQYLDADVALQRGRVEEAEARLNAAFGNPAEANIHRAQHDFSREVLRESESRQQQTEVRAPYSGVLLLENERNLEGRFYQRGDVLGHVVNWSNVPLTVLVAEDSIDAVRHRVSSIHAYLVSAPDKTFTPELVRIVPTSSRKMPSPVLSTIGGGLIPLDPEVKSGDSSFEGYYQVLMRLPSDVTPARLHERVQVRFNHPAEPLLFRWMRAVRRLFLSQLEI